MLAAGMGGDDDAEGRVVGRLNFGKILGGAAVVFFELKSVPQLKSSRAQMLWTDQKGHERDRVRQLRRLGRLMAQIILAV